MQELIDHAIRLYLDASESSTETPAAVSSLPSLFNGLSNDDVWTLQTLAALMKDRPNSRLFRVAMFALEQALREGIADAGKERRRDLRAPKERTG